MMKTKKKTDFKMGLNQTAVCLGQAAHLILMSGFIKLNRRLKLYLRPLLIR